jgi:hypothetical protein
MTHYFVAEVRRCDVEVLRAGLAAQDCLHQRLPIRLGLDRDGLHRVAVAAGRPLVFETALAGLLHSDRVQHEGLIRRYGAGRDDA